MTLTYPILNRAGRILWLAAGAGKAAMLARLLNGDRSIPPDGCVKTRPPRSPAERPRKISRA